MISAVHDISKLRKFKEDYHTDDYKNIKLVGKDQELFFISHYGLQRFPGAVVYDQHKKLQGFYESDEVKVSTLYEKTH
ncbi:MAG: hypothetical protein JWQ38_2697 [Flavipsychrobacter sp.]|nr:hypothetical protein [Flavipsychrobacter sp.]